MLLNSTKERKNKFLKWLCLFFLMGCFVIFLIKFTYLASYPFQLEYGEGLIFHWSKEISQGKNIYGGLASSSLAPTPYPPLFLALYGFLIKIFQTNSFLLGRIFSLFISLLTGYFIFRIVRTISKDFLISVMAGLLYFSSFISHWLFIARIETLGILFSIIGLYFVFRYKNSSFLYLSIPFFLAALLTKQVFLAAPLASFLYLLVMRNKRAFKGIISFLSGFLAIFLLMNFLTEGQFYVQTIKFHFLSSFSKESLFGYFGIFLFFHLPLVALAILGIINFMKSQIGTRFARALSPFGQPFLSKGLGRLSFLRLSGPASYPKDKGCRDFNLLKFRDDKKYLLLILYSFFVFFFTFSVAKTGAAFYYFLELLIVLCIFSALFLAHTFKEARGSKISHTSLGVFLIFLVFFLQINIFLTHGMSNLITLRPNIKEKLKAEKKIASIVRNTKGEILSENASFLTLYNRSSVADLFMLSQLIKKGFFDENNFVQKIKNKQFSLIIKARQENLERYTPKILSMIKEKYELTEEIGNYQILSPRK